MFCPHCGAEAAGHAVVCIKCGGSLALPVPPPAPAPTSASRAGRVSKPRLAFILLGIFLGVFGVHNFFAGYVGRGIAQLLITLLLGWLVFPLFAVWVWNIIEICVVEYDAELVPFD